jgi:hypothetical protein
MLVSAGNLKHHGRIMGAGEPITDAHNWKGGILGIHLASGSILDVSPEVAEQMRDGEVRKQKRALGQRAEKDLAKAKYASLAAAGRVQHLTDELTKAEIALSEAELGLRSSCGGGR